MPYWQITIAHHEESRSLTEDVLGVQSECRRRCGKSNRSSQGCGEHAGEAQGAGHQRGYEAGGPAPRRLQDRQVPEA